MKCLYEVLEISRDADDEAIKKAYRLQALKWHPDKNQDKLEEAEKRFKEISNAFEVLSDTAERKWYDEHRDQILRSGNRHQPGDGGGEFEGFSVEDLYWYFSTGCYNGYSSEPDGFYGVYKEVFSEIARHEEAFFEERGGRNPGPFPDFGEGSESKEILRFYSFWSNFVSVRDFAFADVYNPASAPNRATRRAMVDENQKTRKAVKKEYVEAVRQLAAFVKKRDVRVARIQKEEAERKAELKRQADLLKRQKEEERKNMAAEYQDADWITSSEAVAEGGAESEGEESQPEALWCVVCDKIFKSERAMENHERSRKHREKVRELEKVVKEELETAERVDESSSAVEEFEEPTLQSEEVVDPEELVTEEKPNENVEEERLGGDVEEGKKPEELGRGRRGRKSRRKKKEANRLVCEVCSMEFQSRNQLFKHIKQQDHQSVKSEK